MKSAIGWCGLACAGVLALAATGPATAAAIQGKGAEPTAFAPLGPFGTGGNDYDYDPAFAAGGIYGDRFAGPPGYYEARKLVRLGDGSVVSAGVVVFDGAYQLGLVRYSPSGRREAWPQLDAGYSHYNSEYVVFPNAANVDPKIVGVAGIKAWHDNLYVLATQSYRADNGLDKYQAVIVVFSQTGQFRGWWFIRLDDDVYNSAIAMDMASNGRLTLLGANSAGGLYTRFWTARFTMDANDLPDLDESFGNGGASMFELPSALSGCADAALGGQCPISGVDLKHESGLIVHLDPAFYVAFTKKYNTTGDHDPCVAAFSGSGQPLTSFNGAGVGCYPFDDTGSNHDDEAVALDTDVHGSGGFPPVYVEDIYVLASVARQYSSGSGLLRLDANGAPVDAFGGSGKVLWGGCGSGCSVNLGDDSPLAFARNGAHLGVVGHWKPDLVDQPELSIVDAMDGTIRNFEVHAIASGDANYNDVVGDNLGFTATGWARDGASDSGNRMFVTAHLIPSQVADDTIFRYGTE